MEDLEMKKMRKEEDLNNKVIFALDIGTRSIIGMVGCLEGGKVNILGIERAEHARRTMIDGQIENIDKVAAVAAEVKKGLEKQLDVQLKRVHIAAAGRALRTQRVTFEMELPEVQLITEEIVSRLEAGAISAAEETFARESGAEDMDRRFYLAGYSICQYYLDDYIMSSLKDHHGKVIRVDIIATFLPGEVVESLYTTMHKIGLEVASITLEPIAAINAVIPEELRLLNLALADIGAGTSDIAACRDGSVIGYTMATIAGDEITETIMKEYLVDFRTAEEIKMRLENREDIVFLDVLGFEQTIPYDQLMNCINKTTEKLCREISEKIKEVNGGVPSAVFLSGGGSRLKGLREGVIDSLEMTPNRVGIAGNNFKTHAFSEKYDLNNPEYATPLGIMISAGLNLINDSFQIILNGKPAKLFRSGVFNVRDLLMMNGYAYQDMIGRAGKNVAVTVNGKRVVFPATPTEPAVLTINGEEGRLSDMVHAGDMIEFRPAVNGKTPEVKLEELEGIIGADNICLNGEAVTSLQTLLRFGDKITFDVTEASQQWAEQAAEAARLAAEAETEEAEEVLPVPEHVSVMEDMIPIAAVAPIATSAPKPSVVRTTVIAPEEKEAETAPVQTESVVQMPVKAEEAKEEAEAAESTESAGVAEIVKEEVSAELAPVIPLVPQETVLPQSVGITFTLNDKPLTLVRREKGNPYLLMDMLQYSGVDFGNLKGEVVLLVNGTNGYFQQPLQAGDIISIYEKKV